MPLFEEPSTERVHPTEHVVGPQPEPWTMRTDLSQAQERSREELLRDAVADALQFVAKGIRAGTPIEELEWFNGVDDSEGSTDPMRHYRIVYGINTTFSEVFREIQDAVRELLVQERDYGPRREWNRAKGYMGPSGWED